MRSLTKLLIVVALLAVGIPGVLHAQAMSASGTEATPVMVKQAEFMQGTVTGLTTRMIDGTEESVQNLIIHIDSGTDAGRDVPVVHGVALADPVGNVGIGDRVVVVRSEIEGEANYYLADRYRLPWVAGLIALLVVTAIIVGGRRGASATVGLAASIGILALIVLPQLAGGIHPVIVTLLGGVAIATVTTFITHGANRESILVLASILAALALGTVVAFLATAALHLGGFGSEEAIALTYGPLAGVDFQALLIAGVILGMLGVLDDVAATQVATVKEIAVANPSLTAQQLYRRGMRVGAQHVAALINTLFLAYAGASLPLLLVGMVNLQLPLWAFLNTESVAEEIVRTAVGSGALILAVPIATLLAAWHLGAKRGLLDKKEVV